jgi:hypothetical protein
MEKNAVTRLSRETIYRNQNIIKIIAIICMVMDHVPFMFPDYADDYYTFPTVIFHTFGRITAPVFFYFIAAGYHRTSNKNKYTLRLFIFALLSYFPYIWYFYGFDFTVENYTELNVIFTLLFSLLALRAYYEIKNLPLKILAIVACFAFAYPSDYTLLGVFMTFALDRYMKKPVKLAIAYIVVMYGYEIAESILKYHEEVSDAIGSSLGNAVSLSYLMPLAIIIFMVLQNNRLARLESESIAPAAAPFRKPSPFWKWLFYVFYPAHLTVLLIIKLVFVK